MEGILSSGLDDVFVGANTGRLERLGGELLVLVGDEMATEGEVVDGGLFTSEIEDSRGKEETRIIRSALRPPCSFPRF